MPWARVRKRIHELWLKLLAEHAAPSRLAAAVFVGCVVGTSPFLGLHFFICLFFAFVLRLNKVVVYAAANISIPPIAPLLAFASAQLGERLLYGRWLSFASAEFRARPLSSIAQEFFLTWLVGGLVLGMMIGAVCGAIVYIALSRRRVADAIDLAVTRATERYKGLHPRLYWYARMKYRMDPVYRSVGSRIAPHTLTIDLGAGMSMLSVLLDELGEGRSSIGVEWDEIKVQAGSHAGATAKQGDITQIDTLTLPHAHTVTLIDVLHYFDDATIARVLDGATRLLLPGGQLLIREGDNARSGGSAWTRFIEWVAVKLGWNRANKVQFRDALWLSTELQKRGLSVETIDTAGSLHPGNVLFVAQSAKLAPALASNAK
jgi:uncharacterized protein (DUF2062 family)